MASEHWSHQCCYRRALVAARERAQGLNEARRLAASRYLSKWKQVARYRRALHRCRDRLLVLDTAYRGALGQLQVERIDRERDQAQAAAMREALIDLDAMIDRCGISGQPDDFHDVRQRGYNALGPDAGRELLDEVLQLREARDLDAEVMVDLTERLRRADVAWETERKQVDAINADLMACWRNRQADRAAMAEVVEAFAKDECDCCNPFECRKCQALDALEERLGQAEEAGR